MQQAAEWGLWFLLGGLAYTAIHTTIVEYKESKKLALESMKRHPSHDYSNLDRLDGLIREGIATMERDEALRARVEREQW